MSDEKKSHLDSIVSSGLEFLSEAQLRKLKPFKCSVCGKGFASRSYLTQHVRIHIDLKSYGPCKACGKSFRQLSHLQQHARTHTGEKPFTCRSPNCKKSYAQLANLRCHEETHARRAAKFQPLKCYQCDIAFFERETLAAHSAQHFEANLNLNNIAPETVLCVECDCDFPSQGHLERHRSFVHGQVAVEGKKFITTATNRVANVLELPSTSSRSHLDSVLSNALLKHPLPFKRFCFEETTSHSSIS